MSKTVWPRITNFYRDIHTDIVYSHTGYDIIIYFQSKTVENTTSDGFGWNTSRRVKARIIKFYMLIEDNRLHKCAGNDVTSCFWSAAKCY